MQFIGSTKGSFVIPPKGTLVNIYFHKGDIYQPHYTTSCLDSKNLPLRRMKKYPDNIVFFETDANDYFEMDRITGTTNFQHRSGTKITIYNTGDVEIDCNGRNYTVKNADIVDIGGKSMTGVGGNFALLYSTTGLPPTDSHGVPIQGVGLTTNTKGG